MYRKKKRKDIFNKVILMSLMIENRNVKGVFLYFFNKHIWLTELSNLLLYISCMDLLFSQYVKSILVGPIKKSLKLMSYLNIFI